MSEDSLGTSVGATPISSHERPSRSFDRGRTCREGGCETRLSIYNDGAYCYVHEPRTIPRMRGKKVA